MKYLILTFYYEPDLCAGSFRNTAFVNELQFHLKTNDVVDVMTTMPNRYHTFNIDAKEYEKKDNVNIYRIKLSEHKSGIIDQIFSFFDYYNGVRKILKGKNYDIIFASSSRLFTAFLGARISRKLKIPLYLDIRDIFSETISQVISNKLITSIIGPIIRIIEKYTINSASKLNLVSPGFKDYFVKFYKGNFTFFTNGIDEEFLVNHEISAFENKGKKTITYAGNIGEGQGLEKIIPFVANELGNDYYFRVIGDGGTRKLLQKSIIDNKLENVKIDNPVSRAELIRNYLTSDFLFLHLNNYKAFERVLPSKIFEYAAMNKPIIAGVSGFSRKFIEENVSEAYVFDPCDHKAMIEILKNYKFKEINRTEFQIKYNRKNQMFEMAKELISLKKKL